MEISRSSSSPGSAWRWVPTLYFGQGLPYVAVMTLSVVMYKNLGVSNTALAFHTGLLNLPWVIKPLWSPFVDLLGTKRRWIVVLQFVAAAALALVALMLPGPAFFRATIAVFWLLAFSSATHDIAADGFYLLALPPAQQAGFVGVRSTCYKLATIAGQGGLVYLAGQWQEHLGNAVRAWELVFFAAAVGAMALAVYHGFVLPRPDADRSAPRDAHLLRNYGAVFLAFFRKPGIGRILTYLLLYRFAEAQLLKLVTPFLLDARAVGGLGLSTSDVGVIYGTVGIIALMLGGLVGGYAVSRYGLRRLWWPMFVVMHLPNVAFILLALAQPTNLYVIGAALAVEKFGYGFGFTAYLLFLMLVAEGEHRTAHYAIGTGFMALGLMLPGMAAGWIQDHVGYLNFFVWVGIATLASLAATAWIKVDGAFGRKS